MIAIAFPSVRDSHQPPHRARRYGARWRHTFVGDVGERLARLACVWSVRWRAACINETSANLCRRAITGAITAEPRQQPC